MAEQSGLDRAISLGKLMLEQGALVNDLTQQLAAAKADFLRLEREDLPELMRELNLTVFGLDDGSRIEIKDDVDCSITEENRELAHRWLTDNNFGGLIKTEVVVQFDRGEHEAASEFSETVMAATGRIPAVVERVHSSTLKSFVKEQLEKGVAIPFDTFSIRPYSKAIVVLPKKKKSK